ncbi:MAG: hypothetical protein HC836_22170 [Richelia sp. RM2_1_2]|nr:hypothetical protein [Richelia sp. RM2_1_2]
MKEFVDCEIEILEAVKSEFSDRIVPRGTRGIVVESYKEPECYAVDLAIPNENLVGGFSYENIILLPNQFKVVDADSIELNRNGETV